MPNLSNFLGTGSIVTGFLFSGVIILLSDFISKKLTKGRLHPSAIAIFFGLILAYVGGAITGGMSPNLARTFETHEEMATALKRFAKPGDVYLFKASRGMHLEKVLEAFLKEEK